MTSLSFSRLYYFHKVAVLGSQSAAARELCVSQSTISEQIKLLERELRVDLFTRRGPSLSLTDEGRKAQEHAELIFGAGDRLLKELGVALSSRAVLEIGVAATVSRSLAAELFLPLFDNDELCPRLSIADYSSLYPRLSAGELHILISENEPRGRAANKITSVVVRNAHLVVVGSPALARECGTIEGMHGKPWVHYTTQSGFRWTVDAHLRGAQVTPEVVAESDDLELMRLAAIRGHGCAALPKAFVAADLSNGRLARLGTIDDPVPLYISHLKDNLAEYISNAVDLLTAAS